MIPYATGETNGTSPPPRPQMAYGPAAFFAAAFFAAAFFAAAFCWFASPWGS